MRHRLILAAAVGFAFAASAPSFAQISGQYSGMSGRVGAGLGQSNRQGAGSAGRVEPQPWRGGPQSQQGAYGRSQGFAGYTLRHSRGYGYGGGPRRHY
jgi:hypothetical protein